MEEIRAIRERLKELQAMDIRTARELLKLYIESGLNVHFLIFAIDKDRTLGAILGLAHTEYTDKLYSRVF